VQRASGVHAGLLRSLRKDLGLDGPHHQRGARQTGIGLSHHAYIKLRPQLLARLSRRFDHLNQVPRHALPTQAPDYGAGHIAPANESHDLFGDRRIRGHGGLRLL
jgi:hypothetical protein